MHSGADGYTSSHVSANQKIVSLMRVNSEVGSVGPPHLWPLPGSTLSVEDSNNVALSELINRRTPKADQLQFGSEIEAGMYDYFTIIKHPMDLGTVQARLNKNRCKSPREFSEDVRLTFCNAYFL
ncbi:hypothetical protein SAY86_012710 [Trapa natans]|uniref:Bromo domain-containing protein n=1 Tax=Trapa natans TaxID=22666 RepID=A0AAN7RBU0_TRANT|nr:hypothetical protein SAY86_012710 [Trapa natans]